MSEPRSAASAVVRPIENVTSTLGHTKIEMLLPIKFDELKEAKKFLGKTHLVELIIIMEKDWQNLRSFGGPT
jgi:hypothetical protein